ncbi:MAG: hypothetical protein H6993_13625 [Pseudomonadales bacterium]|nr:hypothetical protein [Pseudomonadales bacterium]
MWGACHVAGDGASHQFAARKRRLGGALRDAAGIAGLDDSYIVGWGIDHRNTRYQPRSAITAANAARLTLKWAYGLASSTPRSWPLVTENTVFLGDGGRGVVTLDRETGCERWVHEHTGTIASALLRAHRWSSRAPVQ